MACAHPTYLKQLKSAVTGPQTLPVERTINKVRIATNKDGNGPAGRTQQQQQQQGAIPHELKKRGSGGRQQLTPEEQALVLKRRVFVTAGLRG
jgi:hypothetical protein